MFLWRRWSFPEVKEVMVIPSVGDTRRHYHIPTDAMPVYVNKYIGLDVACDTAIQRGWLSQANYVMTMTAFNADQYVPLPPENETYYWSLDPQGADRLSEEASAELGFPRVQLIASMRRSQWDETAYDLIREVHISKGFKPDTQDVARALG
ncbi:hypothetical protein B0H10DRAFT_2222615 [Mycena sp. CBHHK59/15]|nr:hypothetical protein B0H10DRAFT_2222615 [Mycena sp. CBHHK59/15]